VLGKNQELKMDTLVLTPTLTSLFSDIKTIDLQFKKPVMKKAALDFIAALSSNKQNGSDTAKVHVRHIEVDELVLIWPNMTLPILNADVTLSTSTCAGVCDLSKHRWRAQSRCDSKWG
jgi:hypothetical protein